MMANEENENLIDVESGKQEPINLHGVHVNTLEPHLMIMKIGSALFYGVASIFIIVINKSVLTSYQFPSFSFLACGQVVATIIVLFIAKRMRMIKFPDISHRVFATICPLPVIYIANTIFGLGSTQALSLPMFTMLRRLSIFMTLVGEYYILRVVPNYKVQFSIFLILLGAFIAAIEDLAFNLYGYLYVLFNDFFTTASNITIKKKLESRPELGKYGLMYYSALLVFPASLIIVIVTGDLDKVLAYNKWSDVSFLIQFFMSCIMGFVLNYSVMLCTEFNSALTTTIIGCLKNILITYLGMFIGGDYIYSFENFVGINISVIGSLLYTWVTFKRPKPVISNTHS